LKLKKEAHMQLFNNLNIKKKLFSSFMILTAFLIASSVIGYNGIRKVTGLLDQMYQEHYTASVTLNGIKADINGARALWLTVMNEKDRAKMDALKKTLQEDLNKDIDGGFNALLNMNADAKLKTSFKELKEVWDAFRETRDNQMFPLIYADKRDEAKALGLGIQAERYKKMVSISDDLIKKETEEAEKAQKEADIRARNLAMLLMAVSAMGIVASIAIAFAISQGISSRVKAIAEVAEAIAKGDLTKEAAVRGGDEIGAMAASFEDMQKNLMHTVSQVREASSQVSVAANQIASGNQDFSQRITEQSASVEETASTMEEMASAVRQNADSSREANKLALEARKSAENGGNVMGDMIMAMGEINKSSKKISEIISVIDEIAFQTNILALNAAVEAARAGEQGRGFAVVAVEVRNLAQRSATAAKEISALIKDSVQKVEDGQQLVNASKSNLDEIITHVKRVADLVGEISAASQEQADGIEQVNKAISQMDQVTQQNASLVEEASATAEEMSAESKQLLELVSFFKTSDDTGTRSSDRSSDNGNGKSKKTAYSEGKGNGHDKEAHAHVPHGRMSGARSSKQHMEEEGFEEF
jgi:methyl-accepting chemotaxis protein